MKEEEANILREKEIATKEFIRLKVKDRLKSGLNNEIDIESTGVKK